MDKETYVIDDHGDGLYVDAAGEDIGGDEDFGFAGAELVDYAVALGAVEAAAELGDFVTFCDHALLELEGSLTRLYVISNAHLILNRLVLTLTKMIEEACCMRP